MTQGKTIQWRSITGSALLLVPLDIVSKNWDEGEELIRNVASAFDIDVVRGAAKYVPQAIAGIRSIHWIDENNVLVFRCPLNIDVWEAAPLLTATETGIMITETRAFFRAASEAAFHATNKFAWIGLHDWNSNTRIRWTSGDIESLVQYVGAPGAWRTSFLGSKQGLIWESNEWPHWFEVTRKPQQIHNK